MQIKYWDNQEWTSSTKMSVRIQNNWDYNKVVMWFYIRMIRVYPIVVLDSEQSFLQLDELTQFYPIS